MADGVRWRGKGWQIRIQVDGKPRSKTVGFPNSQAGLSRALKERERWEKEIAQGREKGIAPYFSVLAQEWLKQRDVQHSTLLSDTNILNHHWLPPFGAKRVDGIRPGDIREQLKAAGVSAKTQRNIVGPLKGVFDLAIEEEWIEYNPVVAVRIKRHQKPKVQRYTQREKQRLLARLADDSLLYFQVMFGTGMRPSELLALDWDDFDGDRLRVSKAMVRRRLKSCTKNYEVRDVVITGALLETLRKHPRRLAGGPIFRDPEGEMHKHTKAFCKAWRDAHTEARVPYRIPYTCRHTRAAELLTAGVEPAYAAKQLGHSLQMFLTIYSEWLDDLRNAEQRTLMNNIGEPAGQPLDKEAVST